MFLIILLYMLLASTFTFGKAVLAYTQPIFFIGMRMLVGGTLLLAYLLACQRERLSIKKAHAWLFAKIALFHIYIAFVFEFIGLQNMNSAKACLLYSLSPFLTALLSYWLFKERLNKNKWIGLLIGVIGFLPILLSQTSLEGATFLRISLPETFLLIAVISSVYGWLIFKQLMQLGYSPLMINGIGMAIGGFFALITSWFVELRGLQGPIVTDITLFLMYMALLIIIANVIFYNLYGMLLEKYSATFISFAGFTCPLFAALYGWLFLGERVSSLFFLSVIIIAVGLYIFYRQELKDRLSDSL